jgi:hypothetical protein
VSNKLVEKITSGSVSSNALSINYSSTSSNVYTIAPSSANNIALTITNVPTSRTAIYDLTFIIDTSTNKKYISTITVNGSSYTMKAIGGLANVSVNASANVAIQNIYIHMTSSTVTNVFTSISSMF